MSLKKFNNMEEMRKQLENVPDCASLFNDLQRAVRDQNAATKLVGELYQDPNKLDRLQYCNAAWLYLAVCKVCGLRYTDSSRMAVAKPTVADLLKVIPGSVLKATISLTAPAYTIDDIKQVSDLAKKLDVLVDKLNESRLYPLTLANLGGSSMRGGSIVDPVNYGAIANMIKHNNNMLLAYGISNRSASGYTSAMHGGRTYDYNVYHAQTKSEQTDVRSSDDLRENGIVDTKLTSEHIGTIVKTINDQIKSLNTKGKKLSDNSKNKVENVINGLINAENQVSNLLENLSAVNAYPPANDDPADDVNNWVTNPGSSLDNLKDAIKEKTRRELKALAISEGLKRALEDVVGLGSEYVSGENTGTHIQ
jgi:hypothetical protein